MHDLGLGRRLRMYLRVSSQGSPLRDGDVDSIERDLEKLDRRLRRYRQVTAEVRLNGDDTGATGRQVTLEVEYGRHHLIAKAESSDMGQAVRAARDEILRQINDRSRGSHSEYSKGK
jgi:ribosome-associated translation inhibitor RaiA